MIWSTDKKTYKVEKYFRYRSFLRVQRDFKTHFRCRKAAVKKTIYFWVKKVREHGTVCNLNSKSVNRSTYSSRPKFVRIQANIDQVSELVAQSPKKTLRRRSQELGIKISLFSTILEDDLSLYPYIRSKSNKNLQMKTRKNGYKLPEGLQLNWKKIKIFLITCGFCRGPYLEYCCNYYLQEVPKKVVLI